MKKILIAYGLMVLFVFAILSILSYGQGTGYVYLLWRGIQIQTNVWFIAFFIILISFIFQVSWIVFKHYLNKAKRKTEQFSSFDELHTYEQLGVAWILEGEVQQKDYIQPVFENSGLLKSIVKARILFKQAKFEESLLVLKDTPTTAFELAEIQRIENYLATNNPEQALTHLEFLSGHALSPWLEQEEKAYQQRLTKLWGEFAVQYPWAYLRSTQLGRLDISAKQKWLSHLLTDFEQGNVEDRQIFISKYMQRLEQIHISDFETKFLWLKLLSRLPEMAEQHNDLALNLLNERFDQDVFYLWFQQQLLKQVPNYEEIEKRIAELDIKYPSMPIFAFSRWHVYQATQREDDAKQILDLYPDNILMNYLRIKSTLAGNEEMIQQLNSVFEKDMNFIQIKI